MDNLSACKRANRQKILSKKNVRGVGIGQKITAGENTGKRCITVLVEKKVSVETLSKEDLIPKRLGGYLVDVIETGAIRAQNLDPSEHQKKYRPLRGGTSLSYFDSFQKSAGTLGLFVKKKNDDRKFILSNRHVLVNSWQDEIGGQVYQPGLLDGGNEAVGVVVESPEIIGDGYPNRVDAALAQIHSVSAASSGSSQNFLTRFFSAIVNFFVKLFSGSQIRRHPPILHPDSTVITPILGIGDVKNIANINPSVGDYVRKSGRTTGVTEGEIIALDVDLWVGYDSFDAFFTDQTVFGPISDAGDSGSAILDDQDRVIALLFAGSENTTIGTPIKYVIEELNLDFQEEA